MAISQEQLEQACFSLISFSGAAKSDYLEAIEHAKTGDFPAAAAAVERGNENYLHAHESHFDLIQEEVSAENGLLTRLTLVHAEDQLAGAETARMFAEQFIDLYRRLQQT